MNSTVLDGVFAPITHLEYQSIAFPFNMQHGAILAQFVQERVPDDRGCLSGLGVFGFGVVGGTQGHGVVVDVLWPVPTLRIIVRRSVASRLDLELSICERIHSYAC